MASWTVYIDGDRVQSVSAPEVSITVTSTGAEVTSDMFTTTWTYQGPGTFLGLSRTQGATQPDSDLGIGGGYYEEGTTKTLRFYSVASVDLTGTTWEFNSNVDLSGTTDFTVDFVSNGTTFGRIHTQRSGPEVYYMMYDNTNVYDQDVGYWSYSDVITILGGRDATDPNFVAWLEANATQQSGTLGLLVVSYNGSYIHTSTSGTVKLKTAGKYLTDDITLTLL